MFSKMFKPRNPFNEVQKLRDQAERIGLAYLEELAVNGKISRSAIQTMARIMNDHPDEVIERIPDRRRPARYEKAMAGLRAASLVSDRRQTFRDFQENE
ncbi:MAG: hypothetical protein Q8L13_11860 [Bradyrhizobium sp.]|uniref:hypothetical protein n=1 Tax=Bradyrhizobium sp. TaxID=376 RepID=UPI00272F2C8F|nr:hypothetical protein [Bradyrhizobium sp.]MDP1867021.1 hypothetical protein [Bradyrhizobium sp.]